MVKAIKQKYIVGSIIAIPLPDDLFAYVKAFNDSDFGVYDVVSKEILSASEVVANPIVFHQASTDQAIKSGQWSVIGREIFSDSDSAWGPPQATCYVRETNEWTMGGVPRINHKGEMRIATLNDVQGMDIMSVCHRPELLVKVIVDRLINGKHEQYKVRS